MVAPLCLQDKIRLVVVGPINCTTKDCSFSCNRVTVKDVTSSKLESHHFTAEDSVKDIRLEEMFQRM